MINSYISNVPPRCTRQCLTDYLQEFTGIQSIYFGDPFHCPPTDLCRPVYIQFDNKENTLKAFSAMAGKHISMKDTLRIGFKGLKEKEEVSDTTFVIKCSIWKTVANPSTLQPVCNSPDRISIDYDQCIECWNALSHYWVGIRRKGMMNRMLQIRLFLRWKRMETSISLRRAFLWMFLCLRYVVCLAIITGCLKTARNLV